MTITEFLNEQTPTFFCHDLSIIEGTKSFSILDGIVAVGNGAFEIIDWANAGVDITKEKPDGAGQRSIFEWLQERLLASDAAIVFCDDGSGEIADFITVTETADGPRVKLFHCKASYRDRPGNRVDDLYDVCGQAVKSCVWIRPQQLLARLKHRATLRSIVGYLKGDEAEAGRILSQSAEQQVQFSVYIVQPGVMRDNREGDLTNLLAAASVYLVQGGIDVFGVISS